MFIEKISNSTVKISLDKQDLERLDISYETIDSSNIKTKDALLNILEQIRSESDMHSFGSKIFVEIFPLSCGLTIYFTEMSEEYRIKPTDTNFMSPYAFSFPTLKALINGCSCLFSQYSHRIFQSCLFRIENTYHLLIYPLDPKDDTSIKLLSEFGFFNGKGERFHSYLSEHAVSMLSKNAVDKIAALA